MGLFSSLRGRRFPHGGTQVKVLSFWPSDFPLLSRIADEMVEGTSVAFGISKLCALTFGLVSSALFARYASLCWMDFHFSEDVRLSGSNDRS